MTVLKIEKLPHNNILPEYKTEGAAGMDLCAAISEPMELKPLERKLVPTGLKIELEHGYEASKTSFWFIYKTRYYFNQLRWYN